MTTPHDTLLHAVFGQPRHARGWLQSQLPITIAEWVVWTSLRRAPERLDGLDLRLHVADVVHLGELMSGLAVYFLLEHSSALLRALRQKLLRYGVHLGRTGTVLVCVVLYHGKRPWRAFEVEEALAAIDRWADLLQAVDRDPEDGPDAVEQIAGLFLRTTEIPPKELHAAFERVLQRPEDTIISTAQRLMKEGEARILDAKTRDEVFG